MIDPRHEEFLNREIDGENSPEESAILRQLIASDAALRERYERLTGLAQALQRIKHVEPPATLTEDVLRAVGALPGTAPQRPTWRETLRSAFARQPAVRYGFAFASGLALGVLAAVVAGQASFARLDETSLVGTMLPDSRTGPLETLARESFELDGARGEAVTSAGRGRLLAELHLRSPRPVELRLGFDPKLLTPLTFQQSGTGRDLVLGAEELRLTHLGDGRYALVLGFQGEGAPPLLLRLGAGERAIEKVLRTGREGR